MKKPLFILGSAFALSVVALTPALAADTLPSPTPTPPAVPSAQQPAKLNQIKTHGASEIDRRLSSLQSALLKLNSSAKLSVADKTTLTTQLKTESDSLTTLKSHLAADTNLAAARDDVQKIFLEYRVYALMLPKASLVSTADRFITAGQKFQDLADKLQAKVDAAKSQNKDATTLQANLDDMKAKLTSAKSRYDGLPAKVINLQPADYNANHKLLADDRDALKAARTDFKSAHDDAQLVIDGLKSLKPAKSSPSPSPSPTATP